MLAVNICVVSLVGDSPPCEFLSILKKVLKIGIAFICVRNSFLFLHLCPLISTVEFSQELRIENYPSYNRCTKIQAKEVLFQVAKMRQARNVSNSVLVLQFLL